MDTRQITFVSSSFSRRSISAFMETPPTCFFRSLPPVPRMQVTPLPICSIRQATSWDPDPEAPMIPMGPSRTMLPAAMATPPRRPTPASGPMTRHP